MLLALKTLTFFDILLLINAFMIFTAQRGCNTHACVSVHPLLKRRVYTEEGKQSVGCIFQTIAQIPGWYKYTDVSQIHTFRSSQVVSHKGRNFFSKSSNSSFRITLTFFGV